MAKTPAKRPAPSPVKDSAGNDVQIWTPPESDQEFVFESVDSAPAWIDKGWASFDHGPALAVPAGNLDGTGPYHTISARVGDTVKFTAAKGGMPDKFTVIQGLPDPDENGTKKPPQDSSVSLEDALASGAMTADDLDASAKAQVAQRSPRGARNHKLDV